MASNSPGRYLRSHLVNDNQENYMISDLLPDVSGTPGQFQIDMVDGFQRDAAFVVKESGYYVNTSDGASTCSSSTTETCELDGGSLLVLEPKSLRSFTTNDEYLFAMKEDLAEWFSCLYQNYDITADNFFQVLETGVLLCKHANKVQEFARQLQETGEALEMRSYFIRSVPDVSVPFRTEVKPGTFQARDNVSNFIAWGRQLGIPEVISFETDDLVLRKNEKSVILCLLEVARIGAKLGMLAPTLVQMEQEIDAELAGEEPQPQVQIKTCDLRSLDERVRDLIGRCTCPVQFPMFKVADGKYKVGDSRNLIFVRILRNHVMVRVGGGWDTLENYLNKHDPCQCNYRGHRAGTTGVVHKVAFNQQRRSSNPNNNGLRPNPNTSTSPRSSVASTSRNRSASPQNSSRTGSPNLVISRHIPAPPKIGASPSSSAKGTRVTPSQNQQELATEAWPDSSSSSSHSFSTSQPVRSNSPSPGRLKSSSPLTVTQSIIPSFTFSRTSAGSSLQKGRDLSQNKAMTPRKGSLTSFNSENDGDDEVVDNEYYFADDSNNPHNKDNTSEAGSVSCDEQAGLYSITQSSSLVQEQACQSMSSEVTTRQDDHKDISTSVAGAGRSVRRKSLSSFPNEETFRPPSALGSNGPETYTTLHSSSKTSKAPVVSRPIMKSYSRSTTPTSSPRNLRRITTGPEKAREKENNMTISELPSHIKSDAVSTVAGAISDWVESTKARTSSSQSETPTRFKTVVGSCSNMPLETANTNHEEKTVEVTDIDVSPQVHTNVSTIRQRPATTSRIPIPHYASHLRIPKAPSSLSVVSPKDDTSSSYSPSQNVLNISQPGANNVSANKPLTLSNSNGNSSSIKSLHEIPLSPDSSTSNEGFEIATSLNIVRKLSLVSDSFNTSNSNNLYNNDKDSQTMKTAVPGGTTVRNPKEGTATHEKLSVGSSSVSYSDSVNTNLAPNSQRSSINASPTNTPAMLAPTLSHSHTSISNHDTAQQMMISNDITFSDDEEINELIKNTALKKQSFETTVHSSSLGARKMLHNTTEDNKDVLMISRNSSGLHAVQQIQKNELKYDSTPKSRVVRRPHSHSKDSSYPGGGVSRSSFLTSNPAVFKKKMIPEGKSKGQHDKESAVSVSSHGSNNISRTEAWVGSPSSENDRKPLPKQTKDIDLSPSPLKQGALTEPKNGLLHDDIDTLDLPFEDSKLYNEMENLFEKYKEMERKASVTETCGRRSEPAPSDKSCNTDFANTVNDESNTLE